MFTSMNRLSEINRKLLRSASLILLCLTSTLAFGWGAEGHEAVAIIAEHHLSPKAKQEIDRLLSLEPGQTLTTVATWADEHRSRDSSSWHYVNFPRNTCEYEESRDCSRGNCVVGAIKSQLQILKSNTSEENRLKALKFLVHFVGDVHQPLHAGYKDDKGGNSYQIQVNGKGGNLHSLWDSGLFKSAHEPVEVFANRLMKTEKIQTINELETNPVLLAKESCQMIKEDGFYPSRKVDDAYLKHYTPIAEKRVLLAGHRLAKILNDTFK